MSGVSGKVVVITGASSGIGEAAARLLTSLGAHVVMGARRTQRLEALASAIHAEGGSAVYQQLDVTELDQVQEIIRLAKSKFGRVDVVLNNAGVMPLSPLKTLKIDEWNPDDRCKHPWRSSWHCCSTARHEGARLRPHHQCSFYWSL